MTAKQSVDIAAPGSLLASVFSQASKNLKFILTVGRLKRLKRTGWVHNDVNERRLITCLLNTESVADHMYRMGMLAFLCPSKELDMNKCMRMALIHDLGESIVGDFTPSCNITKHEKQRLERESLHAIVSLLEDDQHKEDILSLWEEFEQAETPEALFVQDADKFEMIVSALEYEAEQQPLKLEGFYQSTRNFFKTPLFQALDGELRRLRDAVVQSSTPA